MKLHWNNELAPELAIHVAAGGWMLGQSGVVYHYDPSMSHWVIVPTPTSFISLSACSDGTVMGITWDGYLYSYNGVTWTQKHICYRGVKQVSVADKNHYIAVDAIDFISQEMYSSQTEVPQGPVKVSATAEMEHLWGVGPQGEVLRWNPNTSAWDEIVGKRLKQIHVSASPETNTLRVVGVDWHSKGWSYDTVTEKWTSIEPPTSIVEKERFAMLELSEGKLWGLTVTGKVYSALYN